LWSAWLVGNMFFRIYSSLLVSVLLAAITCYGLYQLQHNQRYSSYAQSIFKGSFQLISLGLDRHSGDKQAQWLKIVSKIMETDLTLQAMDSNSSQAPSIQISLNQSRSIQVDMFTKHNKQLTANIDYIGEQHYRIMAVLLLNELGRVPSEKHQEFLTQLDTLALPKLRLMPLETLTLDHQQLSRIKRGDVVVNERQDLSNNPRWVYARIPHSQQVLVIGPMDGFEKIPLVIIILMLALSIIITATMAYILVYGLEKRLTKIDRSMQNFARGQGHDPVSMEGQDAIAKLATTINGMALRIGSLLNEQKEIGQAISHEIRTPISRMKFRLHALLDSQLNDTQTKKLLGLQKDINEIDNLIDEILTLQQGEHTQVFSNIHLHDLLASLLDVHSVQYAHIKYSLQCNTNQMIVGDSKLLTRALQNIIQNGFKHAKTHLNINATEEHNGLKLEISDDGEGISHDKKEQVFTPFIRLDSSRNKKTGGFGLGLAIVKRICDAHGIRVWVEDSPLGGAQFCLFMPQNSLMMDELSI